jgi:hypothetical protein
MKDPRRRHRSPSVCQSPESNSTSYLRARDYSRAPSDARVSATRCPGCDVFRPRSAFLACLLRSTSLLLPSGLGLGPSSSLRNWIDPQRQEHLILTSRTGKRNDGCWVGRRRFARIALYRGPTNDERLLLDISLRELATSTSCEQKVNWTKWFMKDSYKDAADRLRASLENSWNQKAVTDH